MAGGILKENLIVRVGPQMHTAALGRPFAEPFNQTGHAMAGWVSVEPQGYEDEADLRDWVNLGLEFAQSLPAKPSKPRRC